MANREPNFPEYEIISMEERQRRDPRALGRVTLLGDDMFLVKKNTLQYLSPDNDRSIESTDDEGEQ